MQEPRGLVPRHAFVSYNKTPTAQVSCQDSSWFEGCRIPCSIIAATPTYANLLLDAR